MASNLNSTLYARLFLERNVKWTNRKRMSEGNPNARNSIYGYGWKDDTLVVIPEEAKIVRRIFQNFRDGKSRLDTECEFAEEGITTRKSNRWTDSNIKVVLINVTYTGNLLCQKEFVEDPITKKRKKTTVSFLSISSQTSMKRLSTRKLSTMCKKR